MGVAFTLPAFKRAGFVGGGRLMRLATTDDSEVALRELAAAVESVGDVMEPLEEQDLWLRMGPTLPGPSGPLVYVGECEPAKALAMMLELLAAELEARGVSGKLVPAKSAEAFYQTHQVRGVGAVLLLPVDLAAMARSFGGPGDPYRDRPLEMVDGERQPLACWFAEPSTARAVMSTIEKMLRETSGRSLLGISPVQVEAEADGLVDFVLDHVRRQSLLSLTQDAGEVELSLMQTADYGFIDVWRHSRDASVLETYHRQLQLLRSVATHVNGAFINPEHSILSGRY